MRASTVWVVLLIAASAPASASILGSPHDVPLNPISLVPGRDGSVEDAPQPYMVDFRCPEQVWSRPEEQAEVNNEMCPLHILDPEDIMSQPLLVVDPTNPRYLGFHALHGGRGIHPPETLGGTPPPSHHSRHNDLHQPHTFFQSRDGGQSYNDNRYYAPPSLMAEDREIFGEDNAVTLDAEGRVYLGSLYSYRDAGSDSYHYAIGAWKAHRGNRDVNYHESYTILPKSHEQSVNRRDSLHLVYVPEADRVVLLWRENKTAHSAADTSPLNSWIQAYHTVPGEGSRWHDMGITNRIGPCRSISNPIAHGGLVFVGCLPDHGYAYGSNVSLDFWRIHSMDPNTFESNYVAAVPISTPYGRLVERGTTGHMIFIGSGLSRTAQPSVQVSYGGLGKNWQDAEEYGPEVRADFEPSAAVADARVTAAGFARETGYLHLLYLERYDVNRENPEDQSKQTFAKTYAVIRPTVGFQGNFDSLIRYGEPRTRVQFGLAYQGGLNELVFDDLHDSIVTWVDPETGNERIWTTFGDYGYVRFAEVIQLNYLPAVPLPPLAPPPIPLALEAGNSVAQGAAAGALVGLMLLRLIMAKRRTTVKVTA